MKIIAYRSHTDIDVEFLDDLHYVKEHQLYTNFRNGNIKNPYDKTIYNVGYIGVGKHMARNSNTHKMEKAYTTWVDMLQRCYSEDDKHKHPAYFGICSVCDEWKNYQIFADWYTTNYYNIDKERLQLDKDILIAGNKTYSPDTCILIPQKLNAMFLNRINNKGLPNGIYNHPNGFGIVYKGKSLGVCKTLEEAFETHRIARENGIKEATEEYKDILPEKVYNAVINYKFKMELDKNMENLNI